MIRKGDRVTIRPRWMDSPRDNEHPIVAVEDEDGGRVLVERQVPSMAIWPRERMRVYMLNEGVCEHANVSTTGNDVCDDCGEVGEDAPAFVLRGLTSMGRELFFTGKGGERWVADNRAAAVTYSTLEAARTKATMFNRTTELHGVRFTAVQK